MFRKAIVPVQFIAGSLILGIILSALPLLYIVLYVRYTWYVTQRERVIRGLQRKDGEQLNDVDIQQNSIERGLIRDQKSMYLTGNRIISSRKLEIGTAAIDVEERELSNHSGSYKLKCDVKDITEEREIVEIVKFAGENEIALRAMGSLFSWPNIVEPGLKLQGDGNSDTKSGLVLDMKEYNKMVKVLVLPEAQFDGTVALVTVESGMKLWLLCDLLDRLGYALPVLGNVTGQSIGGVITTGTHGKNKRVGTMSSLVQSMRLVLANGEIKNIAMRKASGEFSEEPIACAAGVSLGLLGVISTVTLRVVTKHRLAFSIHNMSFESFIDQYEELLENNEHVGFIYFPYVDRIRVESAKKLTADEEVTLKDKSMPRHNRMKLFFATILNYVLFESVFGIWFGPVVWLVRRYIVLCDLQWEATVKSPAIDKSYKVVASNVDFDIEHHEMEYGYDANIAKTVLRAYRSVFQSLPAHFRYSSLLDIRFSAGDSAWLAASSGRPTVWLDLIRPNVHKNTEYFMNEFKPTIVKYAGRPHFGKENILGTSELEQHFPHFKDFVKIRDELDPNKLFANPYFESLFGSTKDKPMLCKFTSFHGSRRSMMARLQSAASITDMKVEQPEGDNLDGTNSIVEDVIEES